MKKFFCVSVVFLFFITGLPYICHYSRAHKNTRREYEKRILAITKEACRKNTIKSEKECAADLPDMAALQEFLMTMDPATGTVPRERLLKAYNETRAQSHLKNTSTIQWTGYGAEMGGRTRMIMYDPNDDTHKKVWAGGITGGLWYNSDITSSSSSWVPVGDFWSNLSIRCMAYDPTNTQIFYIGTGEAETALQTYRESSGLGTGIWKSVDGGQSWNQLTSTQTFCYTTRIVVKNEGGNPVIYAGVASGLYHGQHQSQPSDGLFRSADGGNTWQQVLPDITGYTQPYAVQDIALGTDGRIYIGTRPNLDGQGGATILFSDAGTAGSWTINNTYEQEILAAPIYNIPGRVVLAAAPSDANVVYALIAGGNIDPSDNFQRFYCVDVLRSSDKGVTWVKKNMPLNNDTTGFATIAWHALDVAVDPNNPNQVFAGGLDMHRSPDGGNNWQQLSDWSLMYNGGGSAYIHADQHTIVFKPGSSGEILFGSDGGVFYTSTGADPSPLFEQHNHNYNTLQFYTCDLSPTAGNNLFIGGLQDNGTLYYTGTPLTINDMIVGGDGTFCFWDKNEPEYFGASYYYNRYTFFQNGNPLGSTYTATGIFLNPADLDYNLNLVYANATDFTGAVLPNYILRLSNIYSSPLENYVELNTGLTVYFSAVTYSQYSPPNSSTLFLGTVSGRLFKVINANSNVPQATEITGPDFPAGNIACIALGGSEDTLMVIFSNYGVPSVWQSNDGGQSWLDKEGNLPDMPVRWGMFYPGFARYAMIATETGVWETQDMNRPDLTWTQVNTGMADVRTDMLKFRNSDNTVLAATHGRGLFTATWDIGVGIQENSKQDIKIYPDPSNGYFTLNISGMSINALEISVINSKGELIESKLLNNVSGSASAGFNLSGQPGGIYFLKISSGSKLLGTKKLIIQ
jgi:hypothetical protein